MKKKKVLLIGWDAADWNIIYPLLGQGKMPALKRLMQNGVHGNLATMNPPYSPMLWTSIATGKTPDEHGILGFLELDTKNQKIRPVTANQRRVNALWNIFHNQDKKSIVVGWWPSFPAEPVSGCTVSDTFFKPVGPIHGKWPVLKGHLHPESLAKEIADLRIHPMEITSAHILPFVSNAPKIDIDENKDKGMQTLMKIMAHNSSVQAVGTYLLREKEWDFAGLYFDMIDHMCHAFVKYHPPKLPAVPQELYDLYKDVVSSAYIFQDMMLERQLQFVDEETLVIVMSDHGFESGINRHLKLPKHIHAAPALDHREFGIFVASGPGIKKNEKLFGLSLLDITPTILHFMGLPVGKDMNGSVILDAFEKPTQVELIDSWENAEGDFGLGNKNEQVDALSEQEAMEQLIELGYVERPDEDLGKAIFRTKCDLKYNLARVYLGKGEYEKAETLLEELIVAEDVNTVSYCMEMLNLQLIKKEYVKARESLGMLRELDKGLLTKTKLLEARILIGEGKNKKALYILKEEKGKTDRTGATHYERGKLFMNLNQFGEALEELEKAVLLRKDNAKYHSTLANCLLRLDRPEDALDHALVAIELMRYFPDAHYLMGEALEKLGDKENAARAYEMAKKLSPDTKRASIALQNIISEEPEIQVDSMVSGGVLKGEIIIVSGLPRSGTSMMMQMLEAGGLEILTDGFRTADQSNPKGYYEYEKTKSLHKDNSWLEEADGKVVKVIAQLIKYLPVDFSYKVIFMKREINEVIKSQQVMLNRADKQPLFGLKQAFENELKKIDIWSKQEPGVDIMYVSYADVIAEPKRISDKISSFVGKPLNVDQMASRVEKSLYRNRMHR